MAWGLVHGGGRWVTRTWLCGIRFMISVGCVFRCEPTPSWVATTRQHPLGSRVKAEWGASRCPLIGHLAVVSRTTGVPPVLAGGLPAISTAQRKMGHRRMIKEAVCVRGADPKGMARSKTVFGASVWGQSFKFAILFDRNHIHEPPHSLLKLFAFRIQRPLVCRQGPPLLGVARQAVDQRTDVSAPAHRQPRRKPLRGPPCPEKCTSRRPHAP